MVNMEEKFSLYTIEVYQNPKTKEQKESEIHRLKNLMEELSIFGSIFSDKNQLGKIKGAWVV